MEERTVGRSDSTGRELSSRGACPVVCCVCCEGIRPCRSHECCQGWGGRREETKGEDKLV